MGLASCSPFSLLHSLAAPAPGGYCPETDLCGGTSLHPLPLLGGTKEFPHWQISNFFTRLQTLGAALWGKLCELQGDCLPTSNNTKDFGGVSESNSHFKFMGAALRTLIFKDIFVIFQANVYIVEKA
jgi:hypothetical protein